jgi:hypothetical protein
LRNSHDNSTDAKIAFEALSAHARKVGRAQGESLQCWLHEEVCLRRQAEFEEQKLRSFVVKHSVVRIHCLVAFAMILVGAILCESGGTQTTENKLLPFVGLTGLIIAASTRNISNAFAHDGRVSGRMQRLKK